MQRIIFQAVLEEAAKALAGIDIDPVIERDMQTLKASGLAIWGQRFDVPEFALMPGGATKVPLRAPL